MNKRIVITGMGINTPLGDTLNGYYNGLLEGRSAISNWNFFDNPKVYSKVGGDLSSYDIKAKVSSFEKCLPEEVYVRLRKLSKKAPFSTNITLMTTVDAWLDSALSVNGDNSRQAVIVAGHNLPENYLLKNHETFLDEPDWIDGMAALLNLDTDNAGSIGEVLQLKGSLYTMGGACASGNIAIRNAMNEIRYHDHDVVVVAGSPLDFSPMGLHAMGLLGAITIESFNDTPEIASRPFDIRREGFVPSHGAATLILEDLDHALARGAKIYAEVLACVSTSDGSHLPTPSQEGQARTINKLLKITNTPPERVDFVCAHATSTPMGDLSEINALKDVFGEHAYRFKVNAPKSMLGHTCWSAPLVETVAAIMQMRGSRLHPSINIDELDENIDIDVCANQAVDHEVNVFLKNSFGFGGINCCALFQKYSDT